MEQLRLSIRYNTTIQLCYSENYLTIMKQLTIGNVIRIKNFMRTFCCKQREVQLWSKKILFLLSIFLHAIKYSLFFITTVLLSSCSSNFEIIYKIQYTPAIGGSVPEDELKKIYANYVTEWKDDISFVPQIFRLDDDLEAEGQYLNKKSFAGYHLLKDSEVEMQFLFFPKDNTFFLRYILPQASDGFLDDTVLNLNSFVTNIMRSRGYNVDRIDLCGKEEVKGGNPEYKVVCFAIESNTGIVPTELELKKMLEDYFFFSTAIKVKHADYELEDFCMYDNIHRCAILYNKKRRTIRLVDTYQDNTSNRDLLISALNRQHFSVFSTRDSLFDPSSGNTNYETFFRFLYFSALDYRWSTQHDENILEYVVSFDE